ncbi:hypothetical protein WNY63_12505 [Pseudoalteromonas neustonica]|uniref:Uncharacterized protein n=1 Tax=Pseudoalteromonas neustonica TaxID=1840331 RepID=A0ABU9U3D3_9GAMM|nr:hypothetical protein [Pseudoalteromonas sp. NEC-BIFX-2020_015]NMR26850.1 hypothetical protein [Pseudoalteromonas sp. NEC-BIFX-2020_015]
MINKKMIYILFFSFFVISFGLFKVSDYTRLNHLDALVIAQAEKRIALDLPRLDLSNTFLKHSGNNEAIKHYIKRLNLQLAPHRVRVIAIGDTAIDSVSNTTNSIQRLHYLQTSDQRVSVTFSINNLWWAWRDVVVILILLTCALLLGYWAELIQYTHRQRLSPKKQELQKALPEFVKVTIDLNNKTLGNTENQILAVSLANKPLCFYLALIEFCIDNPDVTLNQNKDVPVELLELANKYFYRLIELGHTIRKRPNFTNSLEKTLSEIRAALDEILSEYPELKDKYYPPKAHGEGSRSRLHSYGLVNIKADDIVVIGK